MNDFDDLDESVDDEPLEWDRDTDWAEDHAYLGEIGERYFLRHRDD